MNQGPLHRHRTTPVALGSSEPEVTASDGSGSQDVNHLLVVEPDPLVREALSTLLSGQYNLVCIESPAAALSLLRRGLFDAVISEVQLPGMSLSQFWQQFHSIDPDLRVLLYTAIAPGANWAPNGCSGFGEFLRKPAESAVLRAAIARTIQATFAARRLFAQTEELERLASELEAATLERQLYAGILHDINGPLTVISSLADGLAYELEKGVAPNSNATADWAQTVRDLSSQSNLCIDISRVAMRYARPRPETELCDISMVFADLDRLIHFHPFSRGHQFIVHPFTLPVRARTDTTTVFRALLNLTLNALQSSKMPHRVEVYAWMLHERLSPPPPPAKDPGTVWLRESFENRPPFVAVCVRDGGMGIPVEMLPNIFSQSQTTKPEGQGSGLGLGIVRQCVLSACGALQLETKPGQGTSFTIYLPVLTRGQV